MGFQLDLCPSATLGVRGDHHNFKHPASRFIVTIVHPQKDVPVGRALDTVKKIRLEIK
jgi:predicted RNA binding protein YcfA (HicA-like mRNA interferase family)